MATERLSMRKTREILRQKWELKRSHRQIGASLGVSPGSVSSLVSRATGAGLSWAEVDKLSEEALEARLSGGRRGPVATDRPMPDCAYLHVERRKPGVTLDLLHLEYLEKHPEGYRYSQFCEIYRRWLGRRGLSMRQVHRAGEKLFVDYSGKRPHYTNPKTGERVDVELFVAVLGASNFTFAEATASQRSPDFIQSHLRALEAIGGVPGAIVCDQLRSGVTVPCRYEPVIQRAYEEMALHYGTTVLPARPASPKDKAKVEVAVQIAERWLLGRLRNEKYFSLDSLNQRIAELIESLNDRVMRVYGKSRKELFESLDRPALKALPSSRFVYAEWKKCRVNIDYHIEVDHHYYSAHYTLCHEEVEASVSATTVEIIHRGKRVASHRRSFERGRHTTVAEHMPKAHQKHLEWGPSRIQSWAATIGEKTAALVSAILTDRPHPEQGYRSCLGILRLAKRYGNERLEVACGRALAVGARSYRHVDAMLKRGLDRLPPPSSPTGAAATSDAAPPADHENIRGRTYYH